MSKDINDVDNTMDIIEMGRKSDLTQMLYSLKENGFMPWIKVTTDAETGEVLGARLVIDGSLTYYFHSTFVGEEENRKRVDEEVYESENLAGDKKLKVYKFPFDGWATG